MEQASTNILRFLIICHFVQSQSLVGLSQLATESRQGDQRPLLFFRSLVRTFVDFSLQCKLDWDDWCRAKRVSLPCINPQALVCTLCKHVSRQGQDQRRKLASSFCPSWLAAADQLQVVATSAASGASPRTGDGLADDSPAPSYCHWTSLPLACRKPEWLERQQLTAQGSESVLRRLSATAQARWLPVQWAVAGSTPDHGESRFPGLWVRGNPRAGAGARRPGRQEPANFFS